MLTTNRLALWIGFALTLGALACEDSAGPPPSRPLAPPAAPLAAPPPPPPAPPPPAALNPLAAPQPAAIAATRIDAPTCGWDQMHVGDHLAYHLTQTSPSTARHATRIDGNIEADPSEEQARVTIEVVDRKRNTAWLRVTEAKPVADDFLIPFRLGADASTPPDTASQARGSQHTVSGMTVACDERTTADTPPAHRCVHWPAGCAYLGGGLMREFDYPNNDRTRRTTEAIELAVGDDHPGSLPKLPTRFAGRWYYLHDGSNATLVSYEASGGRLTRTEQEYRPTSGGHGVAAAVVVMAGSPYAPFGQPSTTDSIDFAQVLALLLHNKPLADAWYPERSRIAMTRLSDPDPEAPF